MNACSLRISISGKGDSHKKNVSIDFIHFANKAFSETNFFSRIYGKRKFLMRIVCFNKKCMKISDPMQNNFRMWWSVYKNMEFESSVKVRLTCTILWFRHFNKVDQSIFVVIKFRLRQNLGRIQVLLKEVWNFVFLDFLNQIYKFDSN